ncbi:MAG TPA: Wzy polymerase domain-containing protein [Ramlibacter sp.]|jgi:O-antigen ligase|uniref:PglL family O-oligosaccharyltransferase n=1 Tax=Ramlibacter sp. TaxID=1917967 RepID=UPI002D286B4B|nr:Wzy polymerase domain-containing protein [Ramlibacter sp.]HZY17142.1 Wzy polymerase domain-containing protein [Ramlibacter sp.]
MNLNREIQGASLGPIILALVMALGWLLPNHYKPWNTFHTSAWIAGALLGLAFWRLAVAREPIRISGAALALLIAALIPSAQHAVGLQPLRGEVIVNSLYLAGFAGAFIIGEHWSRQRPGDAAGLVLMAACIAAVVSVGLQIYQWLGHATNPEWRQFWIFPSGTRRPYANLGQPNQLGSLLLWGLLGTAWAWHKRWIRPGVAIGLAVLILFGVALCESRTALLTLTLLVVFLTLRRPAFVPRNAARVVQALYVWHLVCLFGLEPLNTLMGQQPELSMFARSAGDLRWSIWRMALDAALERPWLGYGWNHTNEAYLQVFPRHPQLADAYLEQSHNLVLDLMLWVGIPLAAVLVLLGSWYLWKLARSVSTMEQLLTAGALAVLLVHAMLELPLHHGYFLWPFALLAGSGAARLQWPSAARLPRTVAVAATVALATASAAVVHDYLQVASAFTELRFQLMRIGRNHDETPPPTLLLREWTDFIEMSRVPPKAGMTQAQIEHWKDLLIYNTSPLAFRKVVGAYALNGHPEQARYWAERSCAVLPPVQCKAVAKEWMPAEPQAAPQP